VSRELFSKLVKKIAPSNATLFSSKLSNIYSRIGGSYLQRKDADSTTHSNCVIFPIVANLWDNHEKGKVFSGFVIRGPQHSRSPTDRINLITVELFENDEHSRFYLNHQQKYTVWYDERIIIAARRNAIMREDPCYLTLVGNALFLPSNLLGVMTMENPNILANMIKLGTDIVKGCGYWFTERYVEGLVMAACGNSRDEGYFAQLRKLFMATLALKRNAECFNWDVKGFCERFP